MDLVRFQVRYCRLSKAEKKSGVGGRRVAMAEILTPSA